MATSYGKKKRSLMSPFASLRDIRDPDSGSRPKKGKSKLKASKSVMAMPSVEEHSRLPQLHDDSIEEMASMLLEDTTINQLNANTEPDRRLSHAAAAKIFNSYSRADARQDLPQLPRLTFSGDDAWAMQTSPVIAASGNSNQIRFDLDDDPLSLPLQPTLKHNRKGSIAPTIPRKSSKRRSSRSRIPLHTSEKRNTVASREALKASISPPKQIDAAQSKPYTGQNDINDKVQAMLAATKALKGDDGGFFHGPLVPPTKKRRFADYNVLSMMKTVINERFSGRNSRKKDTFQEERLSERLLDDVDPQYFGLDLSPSAAAAAALSSNEIRLNEGENFTNAKVFKLTGHGKVKRKPVADDGKSLRSRKSDEDPFSEQPHPEGLTRVPTNFETRLRDDMSIDESRESSQDLPTHNFTPRKYPMNHHRASVFTDFDAILSSSPVAQSTPRIRLEPSYEMSGKKSLRNVAAETRSVFDFQIDDVSDMEIDTELDESPARKVPSHSASGTSGTPIRKRSQTQRYNGLNLRGRGSKRMKKHPSPSKAELESLEHALRRYPDVAFGGEELGASSKSATKDLGTSGVLTSRDANIRSREKRRSEIRNGDLKMINLFPKSTESMPNISGSFSQQQKRYSGTASHRSSSILNELADHPSMMDIDELSWDKTAYHIGMRPA